MNLNPARTREALKQFDFKTLFINELGWNHYNAPLPIAAEGQTFALRAVAEKSGMVVYRCTAPDGHIPPYNTRRKIEQQAAKLVREHIIIYTDTAQTTQVWQWVKRDAGKPLASREHTYHRHQSGTEHYIEQLHGKTIALPDSAFEKIFAFFDEYHWHLDDRPTRDDKEINPDVLGYVFEKYINQKQMGAYYTKEDITGYISQNTIIPFLFDAAHVRVGALNSTPLRDDPDRYIYDAVKHGAALDLPQNIAAGISDVSKRTAWNKPAPAEYALPTEIWREVVARRQRYQDVRAKLANGEITSINDFITYNLNIRQFARDAIANTTDPDGLRAFWHALEKISVLDPTVGSGAFLFAALNILEDLYEACLDRMQAFVDEVAQNSEFSENSEFSKRFQKYSDFRAVLDRVGQISKVSKTSEISTLEVSDQQRRYFIYKSIIVNNLYGVDIMEEAVEICKLRLFLKLVAQVDDAARIEPLPDIDFNIRAGNTLVGFATREQVKQALTFGKAGQMKMISTEEDARMARIDELAEIADRAFQQFRAQQTEHGGSVTPEHKTQLRARFKVLEDELNALLATQYGITVGAGSSRPYDAWLKSHEPFHWFVEFYGILNRGGFDVIIGNPPYVEYGKVKKDYTVKGYETEECGNLYAFVIERNASMLSPHGRTGMIVPHSAFCTDRMATLLNLLKRSGGLWVSHYDIRPAKLFVGVDQRLAIYLQAANAKNNLYSTKYNRWNEEARPTLFESLSFADVASIRYENSLAKQRQVTGVRRFIHMAHITYQTALERPAYIEALAQAGYTQEDIRALDEQIDELADAFDAHRNARAQLHQTRLRRDDAIKQATQWVMRFRNVARVAVRERPDLAARLGIHPL